MIDEADFESVFTYRGYVLGRFSAIGEDGHTRYLWSVLQHIGLDKYKEVRTLNIGQYETNIDLVKREFVHEVDVVAEIIRRLEYENGNANTTSDRGPQIIG